MASGQPHQDKRRWVYLHRALQTSTGHREYEPYLQITSHRRSASFWLAVYHQTIALEPNNWKLLAAIKELEICVDFPPKTILEAQWQFFQKKKKRTTKSEPCDQTLSPSSLKSNWDHMVFHSNCVAFTLPDFIQNHEQKPRRQHASRRGKPLARVWKEQRSRSLAEPNVTALGVKQRSNGCVASRLSLLYCMARSPQLLPTVWIKKTFPANM